MTPARNFSFRQRHEQVLSSTMATKLCVSLACRSPSSRHCRSLACRKVSGTSSMLVMWLGWMYLSASFLLYFKLQRMFVPHQMGELGLWRFVERTVCNESQVRLAARQNKSLKSPRKRLYLMRSILLFTGIGAERCPAFPYNPPDVAASLSSLPGWTDGAVSKKRKHQPRWISWS